MLEDSANSIGNALAKSDCQYIDGDHLSPKAGWADFTNV
jgi:hypothetical protein